jgi:hypothetical protein
METTTAAFHFSYDIWSEVALENIAIQVVVWKRTIFRFWQSIREDLTVS